MVGAGAMVSGGVTIAGSQQVAAGMAWSCSFPRMVFQSEEGKWHALLERHAVLDLVLGTWPQPKEHNVVVIAARWLAYMPGKAEDVILREFSRQLQSSQGICMSAECRKQLFPARKEASKRGESPLWLEKQQNRSKCPWSTATWQTCRQATGSPTKQPAPGHMQAAAVPQTARAVASAPPA